MKIFDARKFSLMLYDKQVTKKELGKKSGISLSSICSYASGKVTPPADRIFAIAKELGCSVEDLLIDRVEDLLVVKSEKEIEKISAIEIAKELIDRELSQNDLAEIARYLLVYVDHRKALAEGNEK